MVQLSQVLEVVKLVKHCILLGRIYYEGGGRSTGGKSVSNGIASSYAAQRGQESCDGQGVVHPG